MAEEIEGINDLLAKLDDLELTVAKRLIARAARAGGAVIRDEAERRAPRRSGKLASEQVVVVSEQTGSHAIARIGPSKEAFYGLFQEVGTAFAPAQPFLQPAFDAALTEAQEAIAEALREGIEKLRK